MVRVWCFFAEMKDTSLAVRFTPQFLDDIRARLPVSQVVGRKVALKKSGREWRGLSPFKDEKTPSFFVNDQKGFYHCFASGEHGDIFTFLIKTEGLSFPEAVERLAEDAGVTLPAPVYQNPEQEDQRDRLYRLLETAARYFQDTLYSAQGREARAYIERRGLKLETVDMFRIGYAPASRTALKEHLASEGFSIEDMVTSGMLIGGEDIATPYDRFRDRIIFPIRNMKGHVIAFGGRALDPGQPAKYLNSPETPLFHKGRVLFNFHNARQAAFDEGKLIIVEGYMDVIALHQAGFPFAVAPLGTALTADQLGLVWRVVDEPHLCFDGDSAGQKAAGRAIDTAMPLLQAGKSLLFAFLPDDTDPDDLIRAHGADAFANVVARARPMIEVLFARAWQTGDIATPERRALLENGLMASAGQITDPVLKSHYQRALKSKFWDALRQQTGQTGPGTSPARSGSGRSGTSAKLSDASIAVSRRGGKGQSAGTSYSVTRAMPSEALLKSGLVKDGAGGLPHREALLMATLLNHPRLIEDHAELISVLELSSPAVSSLRNALLSALAAEKALDRAALRTHVSQQGLDQVLILVEKSITHRCDKFADPEAGHDEVDSGWRHTLELHQRALGLSKSLEAAERLWHADQSQDAFDRIQELKQQMDRIDEAVADGPDEPSRGDGERKQSNAA